MKQSILFLEAHQATAQMEKEKMKQSLLLLEAHQATAQMEKEKMKQSLLLLEAHQATVQIESIVHAKRAAHPGIVVVSWKGKNAAVFAMEGNHAKMKQNVLLLFGCLN